MVASHSRLIQLPPFPLVGNADCLADLKDSPDLLRRGDSGVTKSLTSNEDLKNFKQVISRLQKNYEVTPELHRSRCLG
jgi:hypothetical protein